MALSVNYSAKSYEVYTAFWKSKKWPEVPASKNGSTWLK